MLSLEKESHLNFASVSGGHRENWAESNMADASPRTDTSTDEADDRHPQVNFSTCVTLEHLFVVRFVLGK